MVADGDAGMRATVAGLVVSTDARRARFMPFGEATLVSDAGLDRADVLAMLKPVLEDAAIAKVGHDLKFVAVALGRHDVALAGVELDTMLAAYLLDASRSSQDLEPVALEQLGYKALTADDVRGKGAKAVGFGTLPPAALLDYAGERADLSWQLAERFRPDLDRVGVASVYRELELPLIPILAGLERIGVRVDGRVLGAQAAKIEQELATLQAEIHRQAGEPFNIGSPKQLGEILFEKLKLPVLKRTGTMRTPSTAVEVLEELALTHDLPRLILEWRSLSKLKGTYIDALPYAGASGHRSRAHGVQPGRGGHRSTEQQRPQPAEHPDPHGDRPRDPPRVRRRPRPRADFRRLLADRTARARAPVGRRDADRGVRPRRRHPRPDGAEGLRRQQRTRPP